MKGSLLGFSFLVVAALTTAACSGADQNGTNSGGNGGKGGSNTGAAGGGETGGGDATGGGNTGGGNTGGGNTGGGNTGGGNTGGGNTGGGGGTPGGGPCGGLAGTMCDSAEYCDFPDNTCGAADGTGICTPEPDGCDDQYLPVCGCDGKVYGNACEAAAAGVDVNQLGGCPAPEGTFPCGAGFCTEGEEFCQIQVSDVVGEPDTHTCEPLPQACKNPDATCSCLSDLPCGNMCELVDGNFTLTCPGG